MKPHLLFFVIIMFFSNSVFSQTDSLVDTRNGKIYPTVKIGNQIWMAENLNYKSDKSYCYQNKASNCEKYGCLYQWEIAKEVCPNGWHLPSDKEWMEMEAAIGMPATDTAKGDTWRGTDQAVQLLEGGKTGFNAKLGGYRNPPSNYFLEGMHTFFWTSTATKSGYRMWYRQMIKGNPKILRHNQTQNWGMSVRCVKD